MTADHKTSLKARMWKHIKAHSHSIIIQLTAFILITGFALYEIRQTRNHIQGRFDNSYNKLEAFSKAQAKKIDFLTEKVAQLNKVIADSVDSTTAAYKKAKQYYEEIMTEIKLPEWLGYNDKAQPENDKAQPENDKAQPENDKPQPENDKAQPDQTTGDKK